MSDRPLVTIKGNSESPSSKSSNSRSVYKKPEDFKILFVYPNIQMSALVPQGISLLSAVLKQAGFQVDLFDSTFYRTPLTTDTNEEKVYNSIVLPFDWGEKGIKPNSGDMLADFQHKVDTFQPDLLAVSTVENTWYIADVMMSSLREHVPTIVGGVFATYAPNIVINHPRVDWVCRGEGEYPLRDLCQALCEGRPTEGIQNIWTKDKNGRIHETTMRQAIDINELPFPDFDIFDQKSLYRPMQGRVYKTVGIETQRGCPYTCTFCNSPSNNILYRQQKAGNFHRRKRMDKLAEEIAHLVKHHGPEFIYFVVDTFLAMRDEDLQEMADMYQAYRIPFWMNTRAETMNEWRAEQLDRMNCLRINIGIEHGNEKFRRDVLKRNVSNETMLRAFSSVVGAKFVTVANSIVGFPDETRELAFDTIKFNSQLPKEIEASGAFIFTPYHGAGLRTVAIEKGYVDPNSVCTLNVTKGSILEMPQFPVEDIQGLCRVFSFYVKMPEERWSEIKQAEATTPAAEEKFVQLRDEFNTSYRRSTVNPKDVSSFDLVISSDSVSDLH